nr:MAG TPA: TRF2-interacting telomeric protein/Rap1 - C terminal domain [Caudoviricetes sp.]
MNLEGVWTDEESNSYSVHEFLCKVINNEATVKIVLEG